MFRTSARLLAVLTLCPGLALSFVRVTSAAEPTPLRIVTFNVEILTAPSVRAGQLQKFRFDHARRQQHERVADVIEVLHPDIVNLVEATSREAVDLVVEILHAKGLTDYVGHHVESNDSYTGMDVAVISRMEPDTVDNMPIRTYYSKSEDPTWRHAYSFTSFSGTRQTSTTSLPRNSVYYFTVAGRKLGFLGLHLKSNPEDEYSNARRTAEAEVARRVIRGEIVDRGYLPIVLGDLNDYDPDVPDRDDTRSTSTKVLTLLKDYDPQQPSAELINVAERIPRVADRYTSHWDWNENGARDPQDVYTMIDHILLPSQLMPYVERVFVARCVTLETSDHFPVVVDLELPAE
jgi:endonuclease/exonuclease/phosphatase family metal-dependent hydrolase